MKQWIIFSILMVLLAGCGGADTAPTATPAPPTPLPSSTPLPTDTPVPTDTPLPTETPAPTSTPTTTPTATLAPPEIPEEYAALLEPRRIELPGGGFSFQAPLDYSVEVGLFEARLISPDTLTEVHLKGSPNIDNSSISDLGMRETAGSPSAEEEGITIDTRQTTLGSEPAMEIEIGMLDTISSTLVMATPLEGENVFSATVLHMLLNLFSDPNATEGPPVDHHQILAAVLSSMQFFPIPESAGLPAIDPAACSYADDRTFGLSEDNPILLYHYPNYQEERIDEYLALLAGPNGEAVIRTLGAEGAAAGSEFSLGQIAVEPVKQVFVTYAGLASPITLYIQPLAPTTEDDLTQPPIPTGFKCRVP
jgi:hypothetical protein